MLDFIRDYLEVCILAFAGIVDGLTTGFLRIMEVWVI